MDPSLTTTIAVQLLGFRFNCLLLRWNINMRKTSLVIATRNLAFLSPSIPNNSCLFVGRERGKKSMGRSPCCAKEGLNRGAWTAMEDKILKEYIKVHGEGKWRNLPKRAGLKRCGKSCRLRWLNYLRPDIKRGNISSDEEELIIRLHKLLGNRWSLIAGRLPGRTDNEIKNYWNTTIGKKIQGHHRSSISSRVSQQNNSSTLMEDPSVKEPNTSVILVRTKARRCTQVVMIPEPPDNKVQTTEPRSTQVPLLAPDPLDQATVPPASSSPEINELDFATDFKMDDKFLSDILNLDFSQLASSSNSNDTLSDFLHETPFLDPVVDWFLD